MSHEERISGEGGGVCVGVQVAAQDWKQRRREEKLKERKAQNCPGINHLCAL